MSHYCVAVFAEDPNMFDDLLAPYSEDDENYFEFIPLEDERIEDLRNWYEKHKGEGETFERYLTDCGYVNDEESGMLGYYGNPSAKWDYYTIDGRDWEINLKKGESRDERGYARKNQFDYKGDYPYVFITPDGEWHSPGEVGWFGSSNDTPDSMKAYKKEWADWIASPENPYVSFVDCHI